MAAIRLLATATLFVAMQAIAETGDHALPDLGRGIAALDAGDLSAAERDLRPLAQRGFVDAQVRLARLYAQRAEPGDIERAVHWYWTALPSDPRVRIPLARAVIDSGLAGGEVDALLREADADGDPQALPLRLQLYAQAPALVATEEAAALAARAVDGDSVETAAAAIRWYRTRFDDPQHLAAAARLCERWADAIEDCYAVMARHYRMHGDDAALATLVHTASERFRSGTLSADALERTAKRLTAPEIAAPVQAHDAYALLELAASDLPEAKTQMGRLLLDNPALDETREPRALLEQALTEGAANAAYYLGRLHLDTNSADVDPQRAKDLLQQAAAVEPAAHFFLGRLYDRGYLGSTDKPRALHHYLQAARAGHAQADLALARLYWSNEGVRVDPVNAYCFARLAFHAEQPGSRELMTELHTRLDRDTIRRGQHQAEVEFSARRAASAPDTVLPPTAQLAESTP